MKKIKFTKNILISFVGLTFIFTGFAESIIEKKVSQQNVGYFVSVFDHNIQYYCEDKVIALSEDGEFSCRSFPIAFYMGDVKLGEISSIHSDGYVFPQDILLLENPKPIYSSYDSMNLLVSSYDDLR